jgi:putative ATPase
MPEGRFHLAQACLYLATCPKSNSTLGFFDALAAIEQEREAEVPDHLKDSSRDAEDFGHGAGYLYPHAYRDHWVAQQYLPDSLQGKVFYQPGNHGYEATIHTQVLQRREAQLAAMLEPAVDEPLAWVDQRAAPGSRAYNRWLQRTLSNVGEQLAKRRDRLFALANVQRHELVLDLNAGTGLLTWEAVRRAPVGGVWTLAANEQSSAALHQQAQNLDNLARPTILVGSLSQLDQLIPAEKQGEVIFEVMIGRNALAHITDKLSILANLKSHLAPQGRIVLVETIPKHTQRLYELVDLTPLGQALSQTVIEAEESIYNNPDDPMINWDMVDLQLAFEGAGFEKVEIFEETESAEMRLGAGHLERWFNPEAEGERPTYAQHLLKRLSAEELAEVRALFEQQLINQLVGWQIRLGFVVGTG